MAILTARQLTKQYAGEAHPALDHANLTIEQGEFVAIVGPSGSGKSTLLHLLGGIDQPTSGEVRLYDTDIYALNQTQLLTTLGLVEKASALPNQLSGGQQQRVAIGRALINHPAVILADEPTGNLDRRNSQDVMTLLRQANIKQGQTLVVITHDPDIASQADRIVRIDDGVVSGGR